MSSVSLCCDCTWGSSVDFWKRKKKIYLLQKNWENVRYRINQVKVFVVSHKWSDRSFPHAPYWGLFISQAVACHLARATKSSWERNDPWFHLNRRPHVVKSILCYWNNRQRLSCEARKPDLQQTRFFFFRNAINSFLLSLWSFLTSVK